jgi:hypothetical protein
VTLEAVLLQKRADGEELTSWIDAVRKEAGRGGYSVPMKWLRPDLLGVTTRATTGADGRFRLTGFGREHLVHLAVSGPAVENSRLFVAVRPGPAAGWSAGAMRLYGARFDFLVGPSKPVLGTVRDRATGKPLGGVVVQCYVNGRIGSFNGGARGVTDDKGQYRLSGVGKGREYAVAAEAPGYFNVTKMLLKHPPTNSLLGDQAEAAIRLPDVKIRPPPGGAGTSCTARNTLVWG